jgi:hypothetical protein
VSSLLKARGLETYHNELGLSEGALKVADNIVIDRRDTVQPRRGMSEYGNTTSGDVQIKSLLTYKDRILRHYGTTLEFEDDARTGVFTAFSGSFTEVESDIRIKYVEANSNLYFTSSDGIKKIGGTLTGGATNFTTTAGFIVDAGMPKALDISGVVSYSIGAFLPALSGVAYRIVWGKRDENNNLLLGAPSLRLVVVNTDETLEANVDLTYIIPDSANTTDFFYQVYRTGLSTVSVIGDLDNIAPGDEMNLVFESNLTSAEISAGTISITDELPDSFRESGVLLYTNPVSGDGILQANDKPPLANDIANFRGSTFYANTQTIYRQQFTLLGVSALTSGVSKFVIGNATVDREYTFVGSIETTPITCDSRTNTTAAGHILLNSATNERKYYVWMDTTGSDTDPAIVGRIGIRVDISGVADTAAGTSAQVESILTGNATFSLDFAVTDNTGSVTIVASKNGKADDATVNSLGGAWAIGSITQGTGETADTAAGGDVLLSSLVSIAQSIDESARSLVRIINADTNGIVNASYLSSEDDLPGLILLEGKALSDTEFYIGLQDDTASITNQFNPIMDQAIVVASMSEPAVGTIRVTTTLSHGYVVGNEVFIYNTTNAAFGKYEITNIQSVTEFDIAETFDATSTGRVFEIRQTADNEVSPNRVYFSKNGRPEAVPIVNFIDVGGKDEPIERIIALRDNLFILKTDGVFILTGTIAPNFSVRLLDDSVSIIAPDSAANLNNQIYMLSTQGVATVADTGVGVISRRIEDKIFGVSGNQFNVRTAAFGVGYETDRSYLLWMPSAEPDTFGTQVYRYNTFNSGWVRWTGLDATNAVVNPADDKLYISAGGTSFVRKERKLNDRTDHADDDFVATIIVQTVPADSVEIRVATSLNMNPGDVITQLQQVTLAKFNRLLRKLDTDVLLDDIDYESTLELTVGADSAAQLLALVTKVNTDDATTSYSVPTGVTFTQIGDDYNTFIGELNLSAGTGFFDYQTISEGTLFEAVINSIDATAAVLTLEYAMPFLFGPITDFIGIKSTVEYAPQHFGSPESLKQVAEGTLVLDQNNFVSATLSFSTDLSKDFGDLKFNGRGVGFWGSFPWGESAWGGEGTDVPFRTLIPRQKQRCRYISVKFTHINAREIFSILGISLEPRAYSTRAYRGI